jgi:hypothetical protein
MMPDFEIPDAPAEKPGRLAGAFRLCVAGPDCVRICTRAFDPSYPPSFDPIPGFDNFLADLRQALATGPAWLREKAPVDYIAQACHVDRALTRVIMQDESALWR